MSVSVELSELDAALWDAFRRGGEWVTANEYRKLMAENAKLREMVRISIEYCNSGTCDECPIQGEDGSCPYADMAHELGVEVDG